MTRGQFLGARERSGNGGLSDVGCTKSCPSIIRGGADRGRSRACYARVSTDIFNVPATFRLPTFLSVTEDLETHTELKILSEQDPEARIPTMPVWIPRRIPGIKFFDATTGF